MKYGFSQNAAARSCEIFCVDTPTKPIATARDAYCAEKIVEALNASGIVIIFPERD